MNQIQVVANRLNEFANEECFDWPSITPYKVEGKSMEPYIHQNGYVGVAEDDKKIESGGIYAVRLPTQGIELRRLFMSFDAAILRAENPAFTDIRVPIADFNLNIIAGRVRWIIQAP